MSHTPHLCQICNIRSLEPNVDKCELCDSLLKRSKSKEWKFEIEEHERDYLIHLMAGAKQSPTKWRRISQLLEVEELDWFRLQPSQDPIKTLPCSEKEFQEIIELRFSNGPLTDEQESYLRRGIQLHDNSVLSLIGQDCFLDHFKLHPSTPIRMMFEIMTKPKVRLGWNMKQFFLAASALTQNAHRLNDGDRRNYTFFERRRGQFETAAQEAFNAMLRWLGSIIICSRERQELNSGIQAWSYDVNAYLHENRQRNFIEHYQNAIKNIPEGLYTLFPEPWLHAWNEDTNLSHDDHRQVNCMRFTPEGVKIRCRRKDGASFWVNVLTSPLHLAFVLSAGFYPIQHKVRRLFSTIQACWSHDGGVQNLSSTPFGVAIQFLQGCINVAGENAMIYRNAILIKGVFGHYYELKAGMGAHGAPYILRPLKRDGTTMKYQSSLCVHNGRSQKKLPIGDTFGSVVMGITNDAITSEQIESLNEYLLFNSPLLMRSQHRTQFLQSIQTPLLERFRQRNSRSSSSRWFTDDGATPQDEPEQIRLDEGWPQPVRRRGALNRYLHRFREMRGHPFHTDEDSIERTTLEDFTHREVVLAWKRLVDQSLRQSLGESIEHMFDEDMRHRLHHLVRQDPPFNIERRFRHNQRNNRLHGCGDIRDGERRWCEVFARVWECMSEQPLNSTIQMFGVDTQVIGFEHYKLKVTLRTKDELTFVQKMATLLGYELLVERGDFCTMIRRHQAKMDARIEIARMLNTLQERQGVKGAPPRWWNYTEPRLVNEEVSSSKWQLHEDLRDHPRVSKKFKFDEL